MSKLLTPQETFQAIADDKVLEYKWYDSDKWERFNVLGNSVFIKSVLNGRFVFRLAQEMVTEMVTVGDVSFPKPESEPLEAGTEYWVAHPVYSIYTASCASRWSDDSYDNMFLKRGLIHLSKENAVAHAKAIIQLIGGTVDD